ncbi:hypothetical protein KAR48_12640 [bacterium]|nr:hypothetical protein [bacterium]
MENYIIKPLCGVDEIVFGQMRTDVVTILGEPSSRKIESHSDGIKDEIWYYGQYKLELDFSDEDDWLLCCIDTESEDAILGGFRLVGKNEDELLQILKELDFGDWVLDDDKTEFELYTYHCDKSNISISLKNGIVQSFWIMPDYDAAGENIIWPQKC